MMCVLLVTLFRLLTRRSVASLLIPALFSPVLLHFTGPKVPNAQRRPHVEVIRPYEQSSTGHHVSLPQLLGSVEEVQLAPTGFMS